MNRIRALPIIILIALVALAACSRPDTASFASGAAATQTVQARVPTLQAQIAAASTQSALTAIAAGGGAVEPISDEGGSGAVSTPDLGTPVLKGTLPGSSSGGQGGSAGGSSGGSSGNTSGGAGSGYSNYDEHDTLLNETLTPGQTRDAEIASDFDAHNWLVAASAGQTMTVTVETVGQTDPVIDLLDPSGALLASIDDYDRGQGETLTVSLKASGTFTIRIKAWKVGKYRITVTLN